MSKCQHYLNETLFQFWGKRNGYRICEIMDFIFGAMHLFTQDLYFVNQHKCITNIIFHMFVTKIKMFLINNVLISSEFCSGM